MAKLPYMQFYPADWIQDTQTLTLAAQGAWINILCQLWVSETPGIRTWNRREFMTLLRLMYDEEIEEMVADLSRVGDVLLTDEDENEVELFENCCWITIKSRRMVRDRECINARKETNKKYYDSVKTSLRHQQDPIKTWRSQKSEVRSQKSEEELRKKETTVSSSPKRELDDVALSGGSPKRNYRNEAKEVLAFLNAKIGRQYRPVESTLSLIAARLKGHSHETEVDVQTCKSLIARKARDWLPDEKMQKYLRPETLFNRTKFESYLGELTCAVPNAIDSLPTMPLDARVGGGHLRSL